MPPGDTPEKRPDNLPEEVNTRAEAAKKLRSALANLTKEITDNSEDNVDIKENNAAFTEFMEILVQPDIAKLIKEGGDFVGPELRAVITKATVGKEVEAKALKEAIDTNGDGKVQLKELAESIGLPPPPEGGAKPLEDQIFDSVNSKIEKLFTDNKIDENISNMAKKVGIKLDPENIGKVKVKLVQMIIEYIAALMETLGDPFGTAKSLRWKSEKLAAIQKDKLTKEDFDKPEVKTKWDTMYDNWLEAKQSAEDPAAYVRKNHPPTIKQAIAALKTAPSASPSQSERPPATPEYIVKNGNDRLEGQDKREIQVGAKSIVLSPSEITVNQTQKFSVKRLLKNGQKEVPHTLVMSTNGSTELSKATVEIRSNGGSSSIDLKKLTDTLTAAANGYRTLQGDLVIEKA